jgi:hypothetical protein
MTADKKTHREKHPEPAKENTKTRNQEDTNDNGRHSKDNKKKVRKVNYVIKDLPIY